MVKVFSALLISIIADIGGVHGGKIEETSNWV
jgi:hypothetical protein